MSNDGKGRHNCEQLHNDHPLLARNLKSREDSFLNVMVFFVVFFYSEEFLENGENRFLCNLT